MGGSEKTICENLSQNALWTGYQEFLGNLRQTAKRKTKVSPMGWEDSQEALPARVSSSHKSVKTNGWGISMKRLLRKLKEFFKNDRAGPLVEEGLIIGLSILAIAILVTVILGILGWAGDSISSLMETIANLLPF
ncbi:MAG: Flp family type IVb pilin [Promethearchaeota archaeon]